RQTPHRRVHTINHNQASSLRTTSRRNVDKSSGAQLMPNTRTHRFKSSHPASDCTKISSPTTKDATSASGPSATEILSTCTAPERAFNSLLATLVIARLDRALLSDTDTARRNRPRSFDTTARAASRPSPLPIPKATEA